MDGGAVNVAKDNAMRTQCVVKPKKLFNCELCGIEFERRTMWQRFCCSEHRIEAFEQRTGKKVIK